MKQLKRAGFALAALIVLAGCGGAVKYPSYYTLHVPPPPDPPMAENVRATLAVREFRSPTYLRQGAIVYKTSPEQIGFYDYHRWAVDPREFVTNAVADRLRASGNFAQVKTYDGRPDINYILSGRLEELEEIDYEGGVKVKVAISAQMVSVATGATVWTQLCFRGWNRQPTRCACGCGRDERDDGAGHRKAADSSSRARPSQGKLALLYRSR